MAQLLISDRPVAFGYKQIWLAVKDAEPQVVADALGLSDARASTWKEGIRWAYEQGYDRERRQYREFALGFDFVDERLATQAEIEAHEARVEAEMTRRVALNTEVESLRAEAKAKGEEFDETILDDERFDSSYDLLVPGEDSVMLLAGRWSLDPMRLEEIENEPGLGLVGKIGRRKYS